MSSESQRSFAPWSDRIHRILGASSIGFRLALKLRNQCDAIVGAGISDGPASEHNGEDLLLRALAPPLSRFIDVGANVGNWTARLLEKSPEAFGLLFEPASSAHSILVDRAAGWTRVAVSNRAVSDICGPLEFIDLGKASELSSAVVAGDASSRTGLTVVESTTIDHQLDMVGWHRVDLLKIDAEGFDWRVLRGASQALSSHRIGWIQFEYNDSWARTGGTLTSTIRWLESLGYRVFRLQSGGLRPHDIERLGEFFRYSNFVAVAPAEALPPLLFAR